MNSRETADLIMLGIGGFTPLDGFMNKAEWEGSCSDKMTLPDGVFWPIPITLSANKGKADSIKVGEEVLLVDEETEEMMGTMKVTKNTASTRIGNASRSSRPTKWHIPACRWSWPGRSQPGRPGKGLE